MNATHSDQNIFVIKYKFVEDPDYKTITVLIYTWMDAIFIKFIE